MPKYDRIKTTITDLTPKSVSNVFQFLDLLYQNNLDKAYFIKNLKNYSIQEQYFICYYAKIYFSDAKDSFLSIELEKTFEMYGLEESSAIKVLKQNAVSLIKYIDDTKFKTLRRHSKLIKRREAYPSSDLKNIRISSLSFRLPLYSLPKEYKYSENPEIIKRFYTDAEIQYRLLVNNGDFSIKLRSRFFKKFQSYFFDLLGKEFDYEQISALFINSFSFEQNINDVELLDLEFENSGVIYNLFFKLYHYYNDIQAELSADIQKQDEEKKHNRADNDRKNYSRKIKKTYVTKLDFMVIMYNAFPQIRDSYVLFKKKNPKITVEQYLSTKSRNIK